ncbi:MAG: hypothetical protein CVU48_06885 [Candidatus Cloacimonetes bacterium HGW-Cloacimonetes-1]|jgi:hypothetical protein|nr:MAG: hypothetical protein CVU48_06885 [Candidatus Cloacimonetes bacterium HGW-Cloacimonetes-1]
MISLQSHFSSIPRNMFEYQASKDGRFGWFLCTWFPEQSIDLEEIQAEIKLEILNSDIQNVSKLNVETWLQTFFADYHWRLHARIRKSDLREKGVSLFLGILFDHELFFVQFGRMLCVSMTANKIVPIGINWKNYNVRSFEDLQLLGGLEKDLKVKPIRHFISENDRFLIMPSTTAIPLLSAYHDPVTVEKVIDSYRDTDNAQWVLLGAKQRLLKAKKKGITRLQISTTLLLLISLFAVVYMMFGNRFIDIGNRKLRLLFMDKKSLRIEQIPSSLNLDTTKIFKQLERIVNLPARNIEFKVKWTTDLPYLMTAAPSFDVQNLYIVSENKLLAYDKNSRDLKWSTVLPKEISNVYPTDSVLLALLADKGLVSIKTGGEIQWRSDIPILLPHKDITHPVELTNAEDPRLDGSILVIAEEKGISVLDTIRGELLSRITFKEKLQYLSDYDMLNNCFYAVVADEILCINLNIEN